MAERIQKSHVQDITELNMVQKGMLYHYLKDTSENIYNVQLSFSIEGNLQIDLLREAFYRVQSENEALRSVFRWKNISKPVQIILKEYPIDISYSEYADQSPDEVSRALKQVQEADRKDRFDLEYLPFRVRLIKTGPTTHLFILTHHHILYDGWSTGILLKELFHSYRQLNMGNEVYFQPKASYLQVQRNLHHANADASKAFWTNYLDGYEATYLFSNGLSESEATETILRQSFSYESDALNAYSRKHRVTKASVIYAAYGILLHKYTNAGDVQFGTVVSNRDTGINGIEEVIANLINTIPLRLKDLEEKSLQAVVIETSSNLISRNEHSGNSYHEIKEFLNTTPVENLFDSVLAVENYPLEEALIKSNDDLEIRLESVYEKTSFPLLVNVFFKESLELQFTCSTRNSTSDFVKSMANNFMYILDEILAEAPKKVSEIFLQIAPEGRQLMDEVNQTDKPYQEDMTVLDLFLAQASKTPRNNALITQDKTFTYRALDELSDAIANYLIEEKGIEKGMLVGVTMSRETYLVPVIFGILKVGAAYVPIDPKLPTDRQTTILTDAGIKHLITSNKFLQPSVMELAEVIDLDKALTQIEARSPHKPTVRPAGHDLAYVIYTSGSTGKPKGVMIEHRSLANLIQHLQEQFPLNEGDSFLLKTAYSFDVSCTEIFGWCLNGGSLTVLPEGAEMDPAAILKTIHEYKVTHVNFVTSMLSAFINELEKSGLPEESKLKHIFQAGEVLPAELTRRFHQLNLTGINLWNLYGPTETTVYNTCYDTKALSANASSTPIGKPLANVQLYVLGKGNEQLPIGVPGELHIGGWCVARGYLSNEELTEQRFITNPVTGEGRLYKTGDLVRWLPDGNIDFLSRTDDQVKIRGFRIELGEVEAQLSKHESINATAVKVIGTGADKQLVGYYISDDILEPAKLRTFLALTLPAYMIPAYYARLDHIPLTASGKLNKKALPDVETQQEDDYEAPATEAEEKLVDIWADVLKIDKSKISVSRSFIELGGHSLKILKMLNQVSKEFGVQIPITEVFEQQDIRMLIKYINKQRKLALSTLGKAPNQENYPLSAAQKRLFFLYEFEKSSLAYNAITCISMEGKLDMDRLEKTFDQLITRHEVLRTAFVIADEEPVQVILPKTDLKIEHFEVTLGEEESVIQAFVRPFQLSDAPLLRVGLIRQSEDQHLLMVDIHHIISDGLSGQILLKEFMSLYEGASLEPPILQYKDFAHWQQTKAQQEAIAEKAAFWQKEFADGSPVLDLPTDFSRPMMKTYQGGSVRFELGEEQTRQLKSIADDENTTLFILLLAVYNVLLHKLTNQEDIVVGTPVAGRNQPELENMLGMFVNSLPLRNKPSGRQSFREFLTEVKAKTLQCLDHQDYPYEVLINDLQLSRDVSRNPLFDTMFAYQNFDELTLEIPELKLTQQQRELKVSQFDLTLHVHEVHNRLAMTFEYADQLFTKARIERFAGYFTRIISVVTANVGVSIDRVDILSRKERNLVINDFNNTQKAFDQSKTIVSAFEKVVHQRGSDTALVCDGEELSFTTVNEKSNQLARKIQTLGAGKEDIIGIMLPRTKELIVSILGVLKAGCAYVPIDPDYPVDRVRYVASHSGLKILLSEPSLEGIWEHLPSDIQLLDVTDPVLALEDKTDLAIDIASSNLAYMIYTSGSTGQPKGVMVEHGNVLNFIEGIGGRIDFEQGDTMLCLTTASFDIFVLETLFPLLKGLRIVLAGSEDQKNAYALMNLIREEQVDAIQITPSHLKLLLSEKQEVDFLEHVKVLMIGGEALPAEVLEKVKTTYKGKVYNMYGPTETTVWSTVRDLTETDRVDIGSPIANTTIRILNSKNNLQPLGVAGELHIGGLGVTRGYFADPGQTQQRFITDPVTGEGRLYKTGDLAKWLPDGNIAYLGRIDNQVKINGFRIELGEIESQLLTHDQVEEAAVVAKEKAGNKFLAAFYVSDEPCDIKLLRTHLAATLPGYMIPSYFMHLTELPLTPNGKLDRKALPDPEVSVSKDYQAPVSTEEKALAEVWTEVLGIDKLGVTDNFFSVGGDSIKSIQIGSRLRSLGYDVTVQDIFLHQTIQQLAVNVRKLTANEIATAVEEPMQLLSLERSDDDGQPLNPFNLTYKGLTITQLGELQKKYDIADVYPLSPMQEGMLFHSLLDGETGSYLGQITCKVRGALNIEAIEQTMNLLMVRYEVLRTAFLHEGYEPPIQVVLKERKIDFVYENIRESCEAGNKDALIKALRLKERADGFDLSEDALMRLKVLQTKEEEHTFIWTHHHVLMDGWCMNIIVQEFEAIYAQLVKESPVYLPYTTPYSKYIQWLEERETTASTRYWQNYLEGYEGLTGLPVKTNSAGQPSAYRLRNHKVQIEATQVQRWKKLAADCGVTPNTLFQLAWSVLLARYNHTSDIMFGAVVSGRSTEVNGIESMVGLFINTIPVRIKLNENVAVSELLKDIQQDTLNSVDHQYHPLSEIKALKESESDLFDHILTFENVPTGQKTNSEADKDGRPFELEVEDSFIQTNYNLSVTVHTGDQYEIQFDYNGNHYQKDTIAAIASQLRNILHSLIQQPEILVKDLSLFSDNESLCIKEKYSSDLEVDFDGLTLQDRLKRSFADHGQNTAIEYKGQKFAYHELAENAYKIAASIETLGLSTGSFIGILCENRYQMISAILAALEARMVFVPLDAGLPKARLFSMVEQAGIAHIITDLQPAAREHLNPESLHWLTLDDTTGELTATYKTQKDYALSDPIYAYFTSGSTGVPKGVVGTNKGLSHFVHWESTTFDLDCSFRFSQFTNPGFDAFLRDLFVPLCAGATLCIPDSDLLTSGREMANWIDTQKISLIHCVPSMFKLFRDQNPDTNQFEHLKFVLLAGEKILPGELEKWYVQYGDKVQLVNLYGTTETTLVKGYYLIQPEDTKKAFIPVGPMSGSQFMLLDKHLNLCPQGATGEIYIRTPYITRGYLNRAALNKASFIMNPFGKDRTDLIYRTGDLGKLHEAGTLEVLGRQDQQVKIRGVRIELDEIRKNVLQYPGVSDAVVITRSDEAEEVLIYAYMVTTKAIDQNELRTHLSNILTQSMVPSHFITIDKLPLTPNGKIDKQALPEPDDTGSQADFDGPSNEIEQTLTEIWAAAVGMDQQEVSVTRTFFEMGGHSLKLLLFVNRVNKHFSIKVSIRDIFNRQTIRDLSDLLTTLTHASSEPADSNELIEISL
ncbi:MAG: surfactin non-ribosomal peptide synthetase SrfAB [Roseivirga sp.]